MELADKIMQQVIKPTGSAPVYNCMLMVHDGKRNLVYSGAAGTFHEGGEAISPSCRFRTGSITKLFTAAIILQLAEEGMFRTEDRFLDLADDALKGALSNLHARAGTDCSGEISVLHLLQHRSGLRDYFADDERFPAYVFQHPSQTWNWKKVMEKYFGYGLHQKALFRPGEGFHYSDTNYLLLALLIEQVTGKPLHQVLNERIFLPLGLKDTYLEFYQAPKEPAATVFPHYGNICLQNINTAFDWGGGGLVSVMNDLDVFIRSLVSGRLFKNKETLKALMTFEGTGSISGSPRRGMQYGPGLQKKEFSGHSFLGHSSAYASMLYYNPDKDLSIILSLNQAAAVHKAEWLLNKIVQELLH